MKRNPAACLSTLVVAGILLAFAIAVLPAQPAAAAELYAAGLSGGKTKPLVDIENKLVGPPKARPIKEAQLAPRKPGQKDSLPTVEDSDKYQLYIEPVYPRKARLAMKQGVVDVQITFDQEGKMKDARVVHCSTPGWGFEQAVLAAALESRLNGHGNRDVTVKATLKFQLQ